MAPTSAPATPSALAPAPTSLMVAWAAPGQAATTTAHCQPRYPGMSARNRCVAAVGSSKLAPRYSPTVSSPLNSTIAARAGSAAPNSTASRSGPVGRVSRRGPPRRTRQIRSRCPSPSILPDRRTGSHTGRLHARCRRDGGESIDVTGPRRDDRDPAGRRDPRYYPPRPPADAGEQHPGMANYPSDADGYRRPRRSHADAEREPVAAAAGRTGTAAHLRPAAALSAPARARRSP